MKLVIIINGKGGCGKDTICNIVSKYYKVVNVSSVAPIKEIAKYGGWDGNKDIKGRKLLSDIKKAFTDYNNLPNTYLCYTYAQFLNDINAEILFVHIREPKEIKKFKKELITTCYTLLIKSNRTDYEYGNKSDNNVEKYKYDFVYENNGSKEKLETDFMNYFEHNIIRKEN